MESSKTERCSLKEIVFASLAVVFKMTFCISSEGYFGLVLSMGFYGLFFLGHLEQRMRSQKQVLFRNVNDWGRFGPLKVITILFVHSVI